MTNPDNEDTDEKPLDPAVARVQARLQRLMLIAGLTLGVGILAVFLAIIYRITASNDKPPDASVAEVAAMPTLGAVSGEDAGQPEPGSVPPGTVEAMLVVEATIPADARLVASTVAAGRIVLTYEHFAGTILIIVDPETLQIVGRLDLKPE